MSSQRARATGAFSGEKLNKRFAILPLRSPRLPRVLFDNDTVHAVSEKKKSTAGMMRVNLTRGYSLTARISTDNVRGKTPQTVFCGPTSRIASNVDH